MAKKRLDYHLNQENKKSQSVLRHLSLPRNSRPPAELSGSSKVRSSRKEERRSCHGGPYTPQPARKTHKRCLSSSETNSLTRNRRNSNPTNTGLSSSKKHGDNSKFMKVSNDSDSWKIILKIPLFPPPDRDERDDRGGRPVQVWRHRGAGVGKAGSAGDSHPPLSQVGIRTGLYSSIWLKLQIVVVCCQQTEKMSTKLSIQAGAVHRTADSNSRFVALRSSRQWEDHAGPGRGQRVGQSFLQHQRQQPHQQVRGGGGEAGEESLHSRQAVSAFHHLH